MAYKWVLNASESRAKILVGQVFAVCCVPVKEGGRCDKVIFVGKSPNKAFQLEMEEIYEAEEKEKEKKQKEAKLALKMRAREIDRDRKAGVGLYNTTLRNVKKGQEALKERMREGAELTMKYGTKNKKKNNKKVETLNIFQIGFDEYIFSIFVIIRCLLRSLVFYFDKVVFENVIIRFIVWRDFSP